MNTKKRFLSLILSAAMALSLLQGSVLATEAFSPSQKPAAAASAASDKCGKKLSWSISKDKKTLTISGSGAMYSYDNNDAPWEPCEDTITKIVVNSGVTSIGVEAFGGLEYVTSVSLPDTLTTIGAEAFEECEALKSITIPASVRTIGRDAFDECRALKTITFKGSAPSIGANAFKEVRATVYTPKDDSSWTSNVRKHYGGKLTWSNASAKDSAASSQQKKVKTTDSKLAAPKLVKAFNHDDGVKLQWKTVSGAKGYYILRKTPDSDWSTIKKVSGQKKTSYLDEHARDGVLYSYSVQAYSAAGKGTYDDVGLSIRRLDCPDVDDPKNTDKGILVRWELEKEAQGYYVYRKTGKKGTWSKVGSVKGSTTLSWLDEETKNGVLYYYTVRAFSGSYVSGYDDDEEIIRLTSPAISSLSGSKVKWTKNSKAGGYQVRYATSSKFKHKQTKTLSGASRTSAKLSGLKKGKTYYVQVRSFKKVPNDNDRSWSAWSEVRTLTVK